VEYYKWKFDAQWFHKLVGKFVLMSQVRFGFLGSIIKKLAQSPFERFKLGGDGMQSYQFLQGSEIIGLRGYQNFSIVPEGSNENQNTIPVALSITNIRLELASPGYCQPVGNYIFVGLCRRW
jgi:outer membrane protein insertion porin family